MQLLYTTVVFITREAFRKVCLDSKNTPYNQINNLVWLCIPIGFIITVIMCHIWSYVLLSPLKTENYRINVLYYGIGTMFEIFSEPFYIYCQVYMYFGLKTIVEGISLFIQTFMIIILLCYYPQLKLNIYGYSHMIYGFTILVCYIIGVSIILNKNNNKSNDNNKKNDDIDEDNNKNNEKYNTIHCLSDFIPLYSNSDWYSSTIIKYLWTFEKQSFIKQILTEAERYLMTMFNLINFNDQGIYDIVSNIGSLIPRFLFHSLEESYFIFFSKEVRYQHNNKPTKLSFTTLKTIIKFVTFVGFVIAFFGQTYSPILLFFYGGDNIVSKESKGPVLIENYFIYVFFLALNGITECYFMATARQNELEFFNKILIVLPIIITLVTYFFVYLFFFLNTLCFFNKNVIHGMVLLVLYMVIVLI